MNAIFLKDNVYVCINKKECKNNEMISNEEVFILPGYHKFKTYDLYGGRVNLTLSDYDTNEMNIDGIPILKFEENYNLSEELPANTICAYLNQIHQLGIDTFLANYKAAIEKLKIEIDNRLSKSISMDNKSLTTKLNNILDMLTAILFALWINMNAGLDDHIYTDTYNNIINLFFQ